MASVQEMRTELADVNRRIEEEREKVSKDKRHADVEAARDASVDARLKSFKLSEKHPGRAAADKKADAARDQRRSLRLELDRPIMPLRERRHVLRKAINRAERAEAARTFDKLTDDDLLKKRREIEATRRKAKDELRIIATAEEQRQAKREADEKVARMTPADRAALAKALEPKVAQ